MPDAYDPFADDGDDEFADDDTEDGASEDEEEGARPAVFVTTTQPVALEVERADDERSPSGAVLASRINGRLIARSAMDPDSIDRLLALGLFSEPVPLGLFAYEEEPGLQCRLFALVPSSALSEASHAEEPWKASVPAFEDREDADEDDDDPQVETILLGHIVRFAADRKHPEDLAAEAVDVLQKILGAGDLTDANSKAIDDLLSSL
jgi:hypothetical protein